MEDRLLPNIMHVFNTGLRGILILIARTILSLDLSFEEPCPIDERTLLPGIFSGLEIGLTRLLLGGIYRHEASLVNAALGRQPLSRLVPQLHDLHLGSLEWVDWSAYDVELPLLRSLKVTGNAQPADVVLRRLVRLLDACGGELQEVVLELNIADETVAEAHSLALPPNFLPKQIRRLRLCTQTFLLLRKYLGPLSPRHLEIDGMTAWTWKEVDSFLSAAVPRWTGLHVMSTTCALDAQRYLEADPVKWDN